MGNREAVWTHGSITYFALYGDMVDENATAKHHVKKKTKEESNQRPSAPKHPKKMHCSNIRLFISVHSTQWHSLRTLIGTQ